MRTTRTLPAIALLICLVATGALAQEYMGPRLDGTVTLRGGQQVSGVILTAQLGIVDGAEIGSRLRDGGYIAVKVNGDERRVNASDIAAIDVVWSQTGTETDPKWKITSMSVTTREGEVVTGQPAWLVHATSLIVEGADGTQQKVYAFPMAGSNFSADNLMSHIDLAPVAAPAEPAPAEPAPAEPAPAEPAPAEPAPAEPAPAEPAPAEPAPAEPAPAEPAPAEPAPAEPAPAEPAPAEPAPAEPAPAEPAPAAPDVVTVEPGAAGVGQPTVEPVPEGSVFATGEPAVITFEVTNPATGEPMLVRFLIVPLPAQ